MRRRPDQNHNIPEILNFGDIITPLFASQTRSDSLDSCFGDIITPLFASQTRSDSLDSWFKLVVSIQKQLIFSLGTKLAVEAAQLGTVTLFNVIDHPHVIR